MTIAELWEAYATRNPSFDGEGQVPLSASGIRKLFNQTWSIAYDSGYRRGLREGVERTKRDSAPPPDFFKEIFKGRR